MKKISILILAIFCSMIANSQILPEYGLYNQNLLLINPADAGINGNIIANMGHKIQWIGFKDAPLNTYFSIDGLMTSSMGLGLVVSKQKMGLINITNINLNYSYRLEIAKQHSLGFGMNINFLQNKISTEGLTEYELADPALVSNKFDGTLFTNGFGISYRLKDLSFDFSIPLLFSYQEKKPLQAMYSLLAYDFYVSDNSLKIQPSAFLKYSSSGPLQADLNVLVDWNSNIWGQITYKTNNNFLFAAGVFVKYIGIGYAYQFNSGPTSNIASSSHEIMIKYNSQFSFSKKKPLYNDNRRRNSRK